MAEQVKCNYFEVRRTGVWRCIREDHDWHSPHAYNQANRLRRMGKIVNPDRHVMVNTGFPETMEITPTPQA